MSTPLVIDLSHHNWDGGRHLDLAKARTSGVAGVIHKATEGSNYQDPFLAQGRAAAKAADLMWGVYHFVTGAPAKDQVANLMKVAQPDKHTLVAVDYEINAGNPANSATPAILRDVLHGLQQALGRRPVLYTCHYFGDTFGAKAVPEMAAYRLWWAQYAPAPALHPTWKSYWLWQYSDGVKGPLPHAIDGVGPCDCDRFDGTVAELWAEWTL